MGILNVDNIQPVGSATTINIAADPNQVLSVGAGTSISSPATDTLALSTLSVERLRIKSDGKVGINQAAPDGMLHVFSSSAGSVTANAGGDELVLESSGNTGLSILSPGTGESTIFFGNPGTNGERDGYIRYYHESHSTTANRRSLAFITGGGDNERLRITADGGVKIGGDYTNTTSTLRVLGSSTAGAQTYLEKNSGSTNDTYETSLTISARSTGSATANYGPAIGFQHAFGGSNYAGCLIASQCDADVNTASIRFYPRNYGYAERLRIGAAGQIGLSGANYGSSGDVLTSQGSGAAPQWASAGGGWTVHKDAVTAFSNALIEQTSGLSASTNCIQIIAYKLRAGNGPGTEISVQLGTSGGYGGTYNGMQRYFNSSGSQETHQDHDQNQWAAWHGQGNPFAQTLTEYSGTLTITRMGGNNFVMESQSLCDRSDNNTQYLLINAGRLELGGALTKLKIYTLTGHNFSHGNITIRSM